ncbi:MAG: 50S ribosomal protein L11 methyltransferase [Actinomycetota bacterium]
MTSWVLRLRIEPGNGGGSGDHHHHDHDHDHEDRRRGRDLDDVAELVTSQLWDLGTTGVADLGGELLAGFPSGDEADRAAAEATAWPVEVVAIETASWAGTDETTTVTVDGLDGPLTLTISAGPTFGHGAHPTTALALGLLGEAVRQRLGRSTGGPGPSVLDVGTGSGVLAVAAASIGAGRVVGIDVDPTCIRVARTNAEANGVSATFTTDPIAAIGNAGDVGTGPFDIVVANVLWPTQRELAAAMAAALAPGGSLITAGTLADDEGRMTALHLGALGHAGHRSPLVADVRRDRGWTAHRFDAGPPAAS